jgi:1,4-alpha-glucan branching enzyme
VPRGARVEVVLEGEQGRADRQSAAIDLTREEDGYFSGWAREATVNTRYRFRLDNKSDLYPDPVSRFQPEGPHGPSVVVDPTRYEWQDGSWRGITLEGQVVYEMHIGTFTPDGTWLSASRELEELRALGISLIEVMPISEFAGRFGWGYDGVDLFAPTHLYGEPDDLRRFVDIAHGLGLGVILDVVYNHLGPDGNYLKHFSPDYFTDRYHTDWGEAINFEGRKGRRCGNLLSAMPAIGLTSSILMVCVWMPRRTFTIARRNTFWPPLPRKCARLARAAPPSSSLKTSRSTPSWRGRLIKAVMASTDYGTTISIMRRWRP